MAGQVKHSYRMLQVIIFVVKIKFVKRNQNCNYKYIKVFWGICLETFTD